MCVCSWCVRAEERDRESERELWFVLGMCRPRDEGERVRELCVIK